MTERKGRMGDPQHGLILSCHIRSSPVLPCSAVDTRLDQVMCTKNTYCITTLLQTGDFLGREGGCRDGFDSMVELAARNGCGRVVSGGV